MSHDLRVKRLGRLHEICSDNILICPHLTFIAARSDDEDTWRCLNGLVPRSCPKDLYDRISWHAWEDPDDEIVKLKDRIEKYDPEKPLHAIDSESYLIVHEGKRLIWKLIFERLSFSDLANMHEPWSLSTPPFPMTFDSVQWKAVLIDPSLQSHEQVFRLLDDVARELFPEIPFRPPPIYEKHETHLASFRFAKIWCSWLCKMFPQTPIQEGELRLLTFPLGIFSMTARVIETLLSDETKIALMSEGARNPGGSTTGVKPSVNDKPLWNNELHELKFRASVIRKLRPIAKNAITILDAFEEDAWPPRIDNPLGVNVNLSEAIRTLNNGLDAINFGADGSGEGIVWVVRETGDT